MTDMWISTQWTYRPEQRIAQTPELPTTLVELVERIAGKGGKAGDPCLILDGRAAHHFGLPTTPGQLPIDGADDHPAQTQAKGAGWGCSTVQPWITLWRGDTRVIVGLADLIDAESAPIMACPSPLDVVDALATWRAHTGHGWAGSAIMSAHHIIRQAVRIGRKKAEPTWMPREAPEHIDPELAYERDLWRGKKPHSDDRFEHVYDMNLAYLAAAGIARIAPWGLKPTGGGVEYTPDRAGWWLIQPEPWTVRKVMSPLGHLPGESAKRPQSWAPRWVTGPTLALLDELTEAGIYGGYRVIDSWTATGAGNHLAQFATPVRDLLYHLADTDTAAEPWRARLVDAAKMTYKRGLGALANDQGRIRRADWYHAIVAQDRANCWRRAWKIGEAEDRWPRWANTDALAYTSPEPDAIDAAPAGLKINPDKPMRLGFAKPESTKEITR